MESNMQALQDGIVVMVVGMGIVFAFLTLMACVMEGAHHVIEYLNKIFPPEAEAVAVKKSTPARDSDDEAIAIALAVSKL